MLLRQARVESESQAVERLWRRGRVESCAETAEEKAVVVRRFVRPYCRLQ